jgi:WD40 repeat protein
MCTEYPTPLIRMWLLLFACFCKLAIFASLPVRVQAVQTPEEDLVYVLSTAWSPDGTQIVTGNSIGNLEIWDVASKALVHTLRGHAQEIMTLKWSPDGTQIASGSPDGTIRIWDALNGELTNTIEFSRPDGVLRAILDIDWSPDSALIAGARETGQVIIWDACTGERRASYSHAGMVLTVAWSPTGNIVASGGLLGDMLLWDVTGQSISTFTPVSSSLSGSIDSIAWSPDGERIAVAKGLLPGQAGVDVYNFSTQELLFRIPQASEDFAFVRWSRNGTELAISNPDGVTIVNSSTGLVVEQLSDGHIFDSIDWSPYGGRLAVRNSNSQPVASTSRWDSAVQIVVPSPSLERLQAIADACNAPAAVEQSLIASLQADQLSNFITQVEALSESTIPPACAADLIAVAEALQSR